MAFSHQDIVRNAAPQRAWNAGWSRLITDQPVADRARERVERAAARIVERAERSEARDASKADRTLLAGLASVGAAAAAAAVKADREARKGAAAAAAASWARFRDVPAFREAFTAGGRIRAGWALMGGMPTYLPAALASAVRTSPGGALLAA